ncbi:MAG: ribosomal RNA small subunit methyltransferase A [Candidatus Kaiserbacteria bacterium]|nr:ribosomal RNA small subunit methyltransferase A [Candidatus Kaiserbacteria bacterium]
MMKKTVARLGQHFLIHRWAAAKLAHAAMPKENETIVEIGPGKGVLTRELLALGKVIAIEKDPSLVAFLRDAFQAEIASGRLTLIESDVRDVSPEKLHLERYVVAANIPYYITGEIIRSFLESGMPPRAMALLVQKEVAQRIVSETESILSISVKVYGTPKLIAKVSRTHFSPPPSVDSAILLIDSVSKRFFSDIAEKDFFTLVRAGFASKRKTISNNLAAAFGKERALRALERAGIAANARAETIHAEGWKALAKALA